MEGIVSFCCCSLHRAVDLLLLYVREDTVVVALPVLLVRVDFGDVTLLSSYLLLPISAADLPILIICHFYQGIWRIGEIK